MNPIPNDRENKFNQLLDKIREGTLDSSNIPELEKILRSDPAFRSRYRSQMRMEDGLYTHFEVTKNLILPDENEHKTSWYKGAAVTLISIAAIVTLLAALGTFQREALPAPEVKIVTVAKLVDSSSANWVVAPQITTESRIQAGKIHLKSGMANIRFDSEALISLEGPALLVIESDMSARLLKGKALVETSGTSPGFTLGLPNGEAINLGTRFSVDVHNDHTTCEVLEGNLSLQHKGLKLKQELVEGEVVQLNIKGFEKLNYRPSKSFKPQERKHVTLRSLEERTVVSSDSLPHYINEKMLLVKMEPESKAQRRALFNINLNGVPPESIESAKLNLNLVPSGLGFAAYLPETITFAIYGIADGELETWPNKQPEWRNTPGYVSDDEMSVNPSETILLGKIRIDRGLQEGKFTIKTEQLKDFLKKDTTGEVSFLITRETYGLGDYSLVHAFASSKNSEASGPNLEVILNK